MGVAGPLDGWGSLVVREQPGGGPMGTGEEGDGKWQPTRGDGLEPRSLLHS